MLAPHRNKGGTIAARPTLLMSTTILSAAAAGAALAVTAYRLYKRRRQRSAVTAVPFPDLSGGADAPLEGGYGDASESEPPSEPPYSLVEALVDSDAFLHVVRLMPAATAARVARTSSRWRRP